MEFELSEIEEKVCEAMDRAILDQDVDSDLYDDHLGLFDMQNFDPEHNGKKLPQGGGWIVIEGKDGKSNIVWGEYVSRKNALGFSNMRLEKIRRMPQETVEDMDKRIELLGKETANRHFLVLCDLVGIDPYFVKYRRTRTKYEYVQPYQYEILKSEITEVIELSLNKDIESIVAKPIFMSDVDQDVLFYMQQRGIPKDRAMLMAKLKTCYFEWNVPQSFAEVFQPM